LHRARGYRRSVAGRAVAHAYAMATPGPDMKGARRVDKRGGYRAQVHACAASLLRSRRQLAVAVAACIVPVATAAASSDQSGVLAALWHWFGAAERWQGANGIPVRLVQHLGYVFWSMLAGMVIALPLGIGLGHRGRGGLLAINVSNIGRAIP